MSAGFRHCLPASLTSTLSGKQCFFGDGKPDRMFREQCHTTENRFDNQGHPADTHWFRHKVFVRSYPVAPLRHVFRRPCSGLW